MRPTSISSVYFESEDKLTDFLSSNDSTAEELRSAIVRGIKKGEGFVVTFKEQAPKALLLASALDASLLETPDGDRITPTPFR